MPTPIQHPGRQAPLAPWLAVLAASLFAVEPPAQDPALPRPVWSAPAPDGPPASSSDGTLELRWTVPAEAAGPAGSAAISFEIEETAPDAEPRRLDAGPHRTAALSGRDDGVHRYRVRAVAPGGAAGPWSAPAEVKVEHHRLGLALGLFALGAVVFLATTALVIFGHRATRGEAAVG